MTQVRFVITVLLAFLIGGCAATVPSRVYLPTQTHETMSFYRNGVPLGIVVIDSVTIMVSIEPVEVAGRRYMRLWFLYKNNSSTQYLLEPMKSILLTIKGREKSYEHISPESPTVMLAHIENEKAVSLIAQAIGGTLQAMSVQPTTMTNPAGGDWKINDKGAKQQAIQDRSARSMSATATMYDIFEKSINSGILRRNTVFPGQGVNGYVYFPLPKPRRGGFKGEISIEPEEYDYQLDITTQSGNRVVEFTPVEGE